jgi:hypothetical protein
MFEKAFVEPLVFKRLDQAGFKVDIAESIGSIRTCANGVLPDGEGTAPETPTHATLVAVTTVSMQRLLRHMDLRAEDLETARRIGNTMRLAFQADVPCNLRVVGRAHEIEGMRAA